MNSIERMRRAMELSEPDRVPVMCQLALGHYFLHSGVDPLAIWYTSEGFAEALTRLAQRYQFDGILINLPGRNPEYESHVQSIEKRQNQKIIRWTNGSYTVFPDDDNPHYFQADGSRLFPRFEEIDPEKLYYVEPWDITGIRYPFTWGFEEEPRPFDDFFSYYHFETIKLVLSRAGQELSIHSEIFSPWSQFLELLNYEQGLAAIIQDPSKVKACLEQLARGAADLGKRQASCGVDAILISSAFAGAGFISRRHYREFVLPYERKVISEIKKEAPIPIYTHTCGAIGDRLELMAETGTDGIDSLDPPPLGTVRLDEAKRILKGKLFIKGNIDPVNTLLEGSPSLIKEDVRWRLKTGKPGGGYILSSACSVSPHTEPEKLELLVPLAEKFGRY